MVQHEAHEETEIVQDFSRIIRGLGMAGMQLGEMRQRKKQHIERMKQARDAELQRRSDAAARAAGTARRRGPRWAYPTRHPFRACSP